MNQEATSSNDAMESFTTRFHNFVEIEELPCLDFIDTFHQFEAIPSFAFLQIDFIVIAETSKFAVGAAHFIF